MRLAPLAALSLAPLIVGCASSRPTEPETSPSAASTPVVDVAAATEDGADAPDKEPEAKLAGDGEKDRDGEEDEEARKEKILEAIGKAQLLDVIGAPNGPSGNSAIWGNGGPGAASAGGLGLSGTGSGGAVVAKGKPPQAVKDGSLGRDDIKRVIRKSTRDVKDCYEQQLLADPNLSGKLEVELRIAPDGSVDRAVARRGLNAALDACVIRVVEKMTFPKPKGGPVVIRYPFVFAASGKGAPKSKAPGAPKPQAP